MFSAEDLKCLDPRYFNIISVDDYDGAVALRISAQLLFLQSETASTRKLLAVGVKYKYATT